MEKTYIEFRDNYCTHAELIREEGEWNTGCIKESQIPEGESWGECSFEECSFIKYLYYGKDCTSKNCGGSV